MSKGRRQTEEEMRAKGRAAEDREHTFEDWDDEIEEEDDPEARSRFLRGLESVLPDMLKRGVISSLAGGGRVAVEEVIRSLSLDKKIARDVVGYVVGQADATRRDLLRAVSREVRIFLENVDLGGELTKILTSISFEVRTQIRFVPNDSLPQAQVKNRVKVRRARDEDDEGGEADGEGAHEDGAGRAEADGEAARSGEKSGEKSRGTRSRRWPLRGRGDEGQGRGGDDGE